MDGPLVLIRIRNKTASTPRSVDVRELFALHREYVLKDGLLAWSPPLGTS